MNTEKQAIILPGLIGGGAGAAFSPSGRRGEGFVHGMSRGIGTDIGASAGGLAGGLAGIGLGAGLANVVPDEYRGLAIAAPAAVGFLGGAGLGGYGGYHAGAGIGKGITGKDAPWKAKAKKKKPVVKEEDAQDEAPAKAAALNKTINAIMAKTDMSLSEKAAAVKAAVGAYHAPDSHDYGATAAPGPNADRTWADWADDTNDDRTWLGFKKTPARLEHDARVLAGQKGEGALKVNPKTNPALSAVVDKNAPKPAPATTPTPAAPNHYMNAGMGAAAGGAAGAMLSSKNRLRNAVLGAALGGAGTYAGSHLASGGNLNTMLAGLGLGGKTAAETKSAFDFGKMLGDAGSYAKDMYNKIPEGVRSGVGMGGLGGAALGGLAGLLAPGHEDEYDDMGNVVGRKQRSRFGAALRGALGGGALGAGAGALAGHFAPNQVQGAMSYMQNRGADMRDAVFGKRLDGMSQIPGRALPQTSQPMAPQMGLA